jgi:hypothetical protein
MLRDQAPAVEPAARLRFVCYRIDLCTDPPEQAFTGHGPERGGQRCRQAELRGDGAWGQASGMLRQDVEDQLSYCFRGGREAGWRRWLCAGLGLLWGHTVLVLLAGAPTSTRMSTQDYHEVRVVAPVETVYAVPRSLDLTRPRIVQALFT